MSMRGFCSRESGPESGMEVSGELQSEGKNATLPHSSAAKVASERRNVNEHRSESTRCQLLYRSGTKRGWIEREMRETSLRKSMQIHSQIHGLSKARRLHKTSKNKLAPNMF